MHTMHHFAAQAKPSTCATGLPAGSKPPYVPSPSTFPEEMPGGEGRPEVELPGRGADLPEFRPPETVEYPGGLGGGGGAAAATGTVLLPDAWTVDGSVRAAFHQPLPA
jgi:hypothetical protein